MIRSVGHVFFQTDKWWARRNRVYADRDSSGPNECSLFSYFSPQTLESDYRDIELKADTVRSKFDNLSTTCRRVKTGWNHRANGEIMFLDRHYLMCRANEFIHSFTLERRSDVPWSMVRYVYRCCSYNI